MGNGKRACVYGAFRWRARILRSTRLGVTLLYLVWRAVWQKYVCDVAAPRWKKWLRGSVPLERETCVCHTRLVAGERGEWWFPRVLWKSTRVPYSVPQECRRDSQLPRKSHVRVSRKSATRRVPRKNAPQRVPHNSVAQVFYKSVSQEVSAPQVYIYQCHCVRSSSLSQSSLRRLAFGPPCRLSTKL